jgi:hypothetical protein
VIIH